MEDLLSKVSTIFSDLHQQAVSSSLLSPPTEVPAGSLFGDFLAPIPPINLLHPQQDVLITALTDVGATFDAAQELSEIHAKSCSQLAQEYEEIYANICFQISLSGDNATAEEQSRAFTRLQKIRRFYDRTVSSWAAELVQSVAARGSQRQSALLDPSGERSFITDYLPKLQAFFQLNPKPSLSDKVFLAKQSRMTVKQINIWNDQFQNRRARAKRMTMETRTIGPQRPSPSTTVAQRQAHDPESDEISEVETVCEEESNDPIVRCCSRSSSLTLVDEDIFGTSLNAKNPAYAFPTKYPPRLQEEPFPCVIGDFTLPKPVWRRECTALPHTSELRPHTMTDLVKAVERLSLESVEQSPKAPPIESIRAPQVSIARQTEESSCRLAPFIVRPPLAPLPSLLRPYAERTKCKPVICTPEDAHSNLELGASRGRSIFFQPTSRHTDAMSKTSKVSTDHSTCTIPSADFRRTSFQRTIPSTGSGGASKFKSCSPHSLSLRNESLEQPAMREQPCPLSISDPLLTTEVYPSYSSASDMPVSSLSNEGAWWDLQPLLPSYIDFTTEFPLPSHVF